MSCRNPLTSGKSVAGRRSGVDLVQLPVAGHDDRIRPARLWHDFRYTVVHRSAAAISGTERSGARPHRRRGSATAATTRVVVELPAVRYFPGFESSRTNRIENFPQTPIPDATGSWRGNRLIQLSQQRGPDVRPPTVRYRWRSTGPSVAERASPPFRSIL